MIEHLILEQSVDTPGIDMDPSTGVCEFTGKSFPADVTAFYKPVIDWIEEYGKNPCAKTEVNLKLDYFNTASSKILLEMFNRWETLYKNGNDVVINWYYPDDDDDMQQTGQEYSELLMLPFNKIGFSVQFM
jgi:hypothetical protein